MAGFDPDTILAGHDGDLVRALEARGVKLTPFEVLAIEHGTYTRAGLLKYARTNRRFVDYLVRQIREFQAGIPGPCRADVETLHSQGWELSERELKAVAQGWGRSLDVLLEKRIWKARAVGIVEVLTRAPELPAHQCLVSGAGRVASRLAAVPLVRRVVDVLTRRLGD